jgi:methyl coenzyme M reductase alpha subunit
MSNTEIKIVRLSSGEELLCEFVAETQMIYNPVIIIPTGEGGISFTPYMPYAEVDELVINNFDEFVMFVVDPVQEMKDKYQQIISPAPSIIAPDTKIIT